jgi:subtilisin family serine protease
MGINSGLDDPVFRSRLGVGKAWERRFFEEGGEVFVIIEPRAEHEPEDCQNYLRRREFRFRVRGVARPYLIAAFDAKEFLGNTQEAIAKEPGPIRYVWYDAPLVVQTDVSSNLVGASDPNNPRWGAHFGTGVWWTIIDTGVDGSHYHFQGLRIVQYAVNSTVGIPDPSDLAAWSKLLEKPVDNHGHGTHVAGIVTGQEVGGRRRGIAPKTNLVSFRLAQTAGNECGREGDLVSVLKFLVAAKSSPKAAGLDSTPLGVNISLSVKLNSQDERVSEAPVCKALDEVVDAGITVVVAAGNYGAETSQPTGCHFREVSLPNPANAYGAIVVGACHKEDPQKAGIWQRSSRGPTADGREKPDLVAPGVSIYSAEANTRSGYKDMNGTSQAAPHVSGVICALMSEVSDVKTMPPPRILEILKRTALSLGRNLYYQGSGLVQLPAALDEAEKEADK